MGTYNSRFYEGRYIEGQLAAKMSKTGTAAYIASFPIPEVIQGVDAFELGARSINPKFKLKVIWVNTWFDPGKEADAAKAAIDQGVDIITQHTDSTAPVQVAEERKVFTFGQSSDMIKAGPHVQLTAVIDNWGPYYIRQTQAALDGTWKPEQSWDGINKGNVVIAPFTNMPADIVKMAEDTKSKISSGELKPFTGPVNKQDGTPWLKAGESAGDDVLGGLNFFVEGVEGSVPK
jgi:simple sugar transport system substrate-binding protein